METPTEPWTLTARWVFPADAPPLERGKVTVRGDRIAAVNAHGVRSADIDLGNAALLPGLVNAHTHLDLSGLRGRCPPTPDFTAWLRGVIRHRRAQTPEAIACDIREALQECCRCGVTLIGDIAGAGTNPADLIDTSLRTVVLREVLGLSEERAQRAWEDIVATKDLLGKPTWWQGNEFTGSRSGLSPHAPYSVHSWLFRRIAARAQNERFPVAIHLAETREELQLLEKHEGPFVSFLSELGVWHPQGLCSNPAEILAAYSGAGPVLLVHGNYLDASEPIPPNATVVYCPRTHAAFGHASHPFREFLARGVRVALGTDSLASNPDLDILAEARFVCGKYPDVAGAALLRMITLGGAEALGWADEAGSLTPGKSADLVVVPLPAKETDDPYRLVFESSLPVQKTLFRGAWRQ
jgi:cytosine/adenosine deaminase-related metal-dependent hydrolase